MSNSRRWIAIAAAIALGIGGVVVSGLSASATPTDLTFSPNASADYIVNTPPDLMTAAAPSDEQAAMLAQADRFNPAALDPEFAAESGAYTTTPVDPGVTLTPAEQATWDDIVANYAAPATKMATIGKTVAGAGVVLAGFTVGLYIGQGLSRMTGFKDDEVCSQQNGALTVVSSLLNGTDCSAYDNALADTQKNIDIMPVSAFDPTTVEGVGVSFQSGQPWPNLGTNELTCFISSGTRPDGYHLSVLVWGANGTMSATGTEERNSYCPLVSNVSGGWVTAPITSFQAELWTEDSTKPNYYSPVITGTVTVPNPSRQFECQVTTTIGNLYATDSTPFTEDDPVLAAIKCPPVPAGQTASNQTIYEVGGGVLTTVQNQDTTNEYRSWASLYPECTNGSCPLLLYQGTENCFAAGVDCDGWIDDPNRSDDYSCTYGTHSVPLDWCFIYGPTFDPDDLASGHAYGDPTTGQPIGVQTSPTTIDTLEASYLKDDWVTTGEFAPLTEPAKEKVAREVAERCLADATIPLEGTQQAGELPIVHLTAPDCTKRSIFAPGNDVAEATVHDGEAILAGQASYLHYESETDKSSGDNPVLRRWYRQSQYNGCGPGYVKGVTNCDEYPYYSTMEGGPGASLKNINAADNQKEGRLLGDFFAACGVNAAEPDFIVTPTLADTPDVQVGDSPSAGICIEP
jgi:hypothetical protein